MAAPQQSLHYESVQFGGLKESSHSKVASLFDCLRQLYPMDKNGPMSGRCGPQTDQMENFLSQTFAFANIHGEYIVHGVKSFQLSRRASDMSPSTEILFPNATVDSFAMTIREIIDWQHSYAVYADKNVNGIDKQFLQRALQGQSKDGEEAFRMKFVVRISTCPILMEFDAKLISRKLNESWPHNIKLVSVTGIDFAGRQHDTGDILYYISNWRQVFEIDSKTGLPLVHLGRDFHPKRDGPPAKLDEDRVLNDLMRMARLRLRACDEEGVQIVVETGIGLGVFAGSQIGIDGQIRALSAKAIRKVLKHDGSLYRNIRGVVFALPIFGKSIRGQPIVDTYHAFAREFEEAHYSGPIPVLIADQDMHRLTVAIARRGFVVSELNPADSHGVFGEYWQNRGPAVEEKLALTTVGLLVQHHLFNEKVLRSSKYHLLEIGQRHPYDGPAFISTNDENTRATCCPYQ